MKKGFQNIILNFAIIYCDLTSILKTPEPCYYLCVPSPVLNLKNRIN